MGRFVLSCFFIFILLSSSTFVVSFNSNQNTSFLSFPHSFFFTASAETSTINGENPASSISSPNFPISLELDTKQKSFFKELKILEATDLSYKYQALLPEGGILTGEFVLKPNVQINLTKQDIAEAVNTGRPVFNYKKDYTTYSPDLVERKTHFVIPYDALPKQAAEKIKQQPNELLQLQAQSSNNQPGDYNGPTISGPDGPPPNPIRVGLTDEETKYLLEKIYKAFEDGRTILEGVEAVFYETITNSPEIKRLLEKPIDILSLEKGSDILKGTEIEGIHERFGSMMTLLDAFGFAKDSYEIYSAFNEASECLKKSKDWKIKPFEPSEIQDYKKNLIGLTYDAAETLLVFTLWDQVKDKAPGWGPFVAYSVFVPVTSNLENLKDTFKANFEKYAKGLTSACNIKEQPKKDNTIPIDRKPPPLTDPVPNSVRCSTDFRPPFYCIEGTFTHTFKEDSSNDGCSITSTASGSFAIGFEDVISSETHRYAWDNGGTDMVLKILPEYDSGADRGGFVINENYVNSGIMEVHKCSHDTITITGPIQLVVGAPVISLGTHNISHFDISYYCGSVEQGGGWKNTCTVTPNDDSGLNILPYIGEICYFAPFHLDNMIGIHTVPSERGSGKCTLTISSITPFPDIEQLIGKTEKDISKESTLPGKKDETTKGGSKESTPTDKKGAGSKDSVNTIGTVPLHDIAIDVGGFSPQAFSIMGNVTWFNNDVRTHTVVSGNPTTGPTGIFDSGDIKPGKTFKLENVESGTYEYYCKIQPSMVGTISIMNG